MRKNGVKNGVIFSVAAMMAVTMMVGCGNKAETAVVPEDVIHAAGIDIGIYTIDFKNEFISSYLSIPGEILSVSFQHCYVSL